MATRPLRSPLNRRMLAAIASVALVSPFLTAVASGSVPQTRYLLSIAGEDLSVVSADVTHSGGQVLQSFPVADAMLVTLPTGTPTPAGTVAVPDQEMTFNGTTTEASDAPASTYRETIRTPESASGSGVTVALVDTGVADTGEVDVEHVNVSGGQAGDGLGHGTFLAGLIAGDGASSDGAYQGVAPDAKVLDVQVALPDGTTSLSRVLAGLQAVADRRANDESIKVLSLALSTGSPLPPYLDPLTRGLRTLWADGVTVVVAAGNDGFNTVTSPAADPALLAVGATDDQRTADPADDVIADFSAWNNSFGIMRPDVVAPGVSLVSLRAPGSIADLENPQASVGSTYFKGTGTSMSSAVTTGAVAALLAERESLRPDDVKRLLMGTTFTSDSVAERNGAGAGQVDLTKATATDLSATDPPRYDWEQGRFAPNEADAATWAAFGAAWEAGDLRGVVTAWIALSPQTRRWAANAWALIVATRALQSQQGLFEFRVWAGRKWSIQNWEGRKWSDDDWVGRKWSTIDWSGRKWSQDTWMNWDWEGRKWSSHDWLAFAWTARTDSAELANLWANGDWEGRKWSAFWLGRKWSGRKWSDEEWAGRKWSVDDWTGRKWSDTAWEGRKWSDAIWDGRKWSTGEWTGRKWSDFTFDGRKWSTELWAGRKWSVTGWGQ